MGVSTIGSIWNLFIIWNIISIGAKIASVASGVLFQLLMAVVFLGLYKSTPQLEVNDSKLDELVKELEAKNE